MKINHDYESNQHETREFLMRSIFKKMKESVSQDSIVFPVQSIDVSSGLGIDVIYGNNKLRILGRSLAKHLVFPSVFLQSLWSIGMTINF